MAVFAQARNSSTDNVRNSVNGFFLLLPSPLLLAVVKYGLVVVVFNTGIDSVSVLVVIPSSGRVR
jgi:hypothetical protein